MDWAALITCCAVCCLVGLMWTDLIDVIERYDDAPPDAQAPRVSVPYANAETLARRHAAELDNQLGPRQ